MSINKQSDIAGSIQIGPTDQAMVRIYVEGNGFELPFDFTPDEATEIAEELLAAAQTAREIDSPQKPDQKPGSRGNQKTRRRG